jgi:hypothetical protein
MKKTSSKRRSLVMAAILLVGIAVVGSMTV